MLVQSSKKTTHTMHAEERSRRALRLGFGQDSALIRCFSSFLSSAWFPVHVSRCQLRILRCLPRSSIPLPLP